MDKEHHGIAVPLSSLRTKKSSGIGEFSDLIPMIDWCIKNNFDVIQLLPINDTGSDPSPYNALSGSALHPIYITLRDLSKTGDPLLEKLLQELEILNGEKRLAYHEVLEKKLLFLERYYELEGKTEPIEEWQKKHDHLLPYILFKILKENMQGENWQDWPDKIKNCSHKHYQELLDEHKEQVRYQFFLQYLCFKQLCQVKEYASSKNFLLKGDVPILISPDSADVWHNKEFFDLTHAAGAPPDKFTPDGQYWGFPLYRWKALENDHFSWWKTRLHYAETFFHLYRIDHVIGFFRIWTIKRGMPANSGQFTPIETWEALAQGRKLLAMIKEATDMQPIAEDLGIVFEGMPEIMEELEIPGTKVMRWEKGPPEKYPKLSMTSLSTHDSETLAQWWEDEPEEVKKFCKLANISYETKLTKELRKKILYASHHSNSLYHINLLGEYLALDERLVWENLDDERINRPGKVLPENWTYRMRPFIEDIIPMEQLR